MIPRYEFWGDVFPNEKHLKRFALKMAFATLPFVAIAAFLVMLDWYTHFPVEIGVGAYEIGGGVLGLFLVLRTNAGYERWWEARKLWGGITNQCRNLAITAVAQSADANWSMELARWVILFAHASRRHLRGETSLPELARLFGPDADIDIHSGDHIPLRIAVRIAGKLRSAAESGLLSPSALMQLERERMSLIDHLGGCERILKTPLPSVYNTIIRQFIVAFLITFPFGILQSVAWLTPLITAFVALPMLALDEIGAELQDPFSKDNINHLPLDEICDSIERNLNSLVRCEQLTNN